MSLPPPSPPRRILLVEDHDFIREELVQQLEAPGREIVACASAEAALDQARAWRAAGLALDLLVTDVSLPGRTGIELVRDLQALQADLPVVLCTGYDLGAAAASLGPRVACVPKDAPEDALRLTVDAVLAAGPTTAP